MEETAKKNKAKSRIWEIDFLRGVCILLMVFDHAMFDFAFMPYWTSNYKQVENIVINEIVEFAEYYWHSETRRAVREAVLFTFFILSGISCTLSRSNSKRLLRLSAAALILTLVTGVADEIFRMGMFIFFGILHIMALSLAVYMLQKKIWDNKYFYLAFGLILIIIGLCIDFKNITYFGRYEPTLTEISFEGFMRTIVGLNNYGADSYGIVPYTGVFLSGAFFGRVIYEDKHTLMPYLNGEWHRPVSFVGRNTIWVYLLHQPIIYGAVMIICRLAGYDF